MTKITEENSVMQCKESNVNNIITKAYWNSESYFPEYKQSNMKQGNFVRSKEKNSGMLCNIHPILWQRS